METIEARIHITITEDAAKDEKKLQEQMRSLSNEIYKVCGVPPHVLVEVGNKPTEWKDSHSAIKEAVKQVREEMNREAEASRRRQGRY
jgi:gas vesicle protein